MQNTTERRQLILEYISDNRHVHIQNIADEFHISRRTAINDIQILQCSYPIYTQTSGAGGVFAMDGWYLSRRYLRDDQEALLRDLLPGLQPEQQKTMEAILTAFARPRV
jgi:predicted DNA-binding transcriptional regulator YafY